MCAIMDGVASTRRDTAFAFLCSPTDVFVAPAETVAAVTTNLSNAPLWQKVVKAIGCGRVLVPNLARKHSNGARVINGIVVAQVCASDLSVGLDWTHS